ncbi:MAG: glycosyl hydrolase [Candidatus Eisenbacteria bacterium]|nr:glycosyl hydrolase [Candidatus Latescibacterota bacterium]MBD3301463.1 glycosyl hydrolase [Candidatus Eisenbacteria bacterium]
MFPPGWAAPARAEPKPADRRFVQRESARRERSPMRSHRLPLLLLAAAALLGIVLSIVPEREEARPWKSWNPNEIQLERPDSWFFRQRAYPYTDIPEPARRRAFEEARTFQTLHQDGVRMVGEWEAAGPDNVGGRVTALAVPTGQPTTIYLGAADGGVWKSTDAGFSWVPRFDDRPSLSIGALAVSPDDPSVVYAGTGEANAAGDTYAGDGVWRTTDGGTTWENVGLEATAKIGKIAIDPTDGDRLFVAAMGRLYSTNPERGLYRSLDGGTLWEQVLFVNDSTGVVDVAVDPQDPDVVFAAAWERIRRPSHRQAGGFGSGIYKSTDGGDTWSLLGPANGLPGPGPDVGRIGLAIAASDPNTIYCFYCDHPGYFLGAYRSTNGGDDWTRLNDGAIDDVVSSFGWYFGQIRVDPTDPDRVYVLGVPMYRSTNGGSSWSSFGNAMHVDHHALWIDPNDPDRMYAGNDGGFYRSTNGGSTWSKTGNQPFTQFYAITVDEQRPWRLYGGTQDNSTNRTWDGGIDDWDVIYYGDGFYTLVDPTDSNVIYAEYQYGGLGKSTNGGASWDWPKTSGIPSNDRRNWSTPVVMDPQDPNTLYYGTYRLFRSTNGADSWNAISDDLTDGDPGGNLAYATVTTIDVAPNDPDALIAGTDDGNVWISDDGGASWTSVSAGLPERWVTRVGFDPTDPTIAYVTLSGYRIDESLPHVFRTTNGGADWQDISSNLPGIPLNDVLVDPEETSRIFVASDAGVFWSPDLGASWMPLGSGLPNSAVHDLHLHNGTRKLVAGTHGRSMFTYDLDQIVTGIEDAAAAAPERIRVTVAPNPITATAVFQLSVARAGRVTIDLYDVGGRRVRRIADREAEAGSLALSWDGTDDRGERVPGGAYFYRVASGGAVSVGKVLIGK